MSKKDHPYAELVTVGHGQLSAAEFTELVAGAGVTAVVDVRRFPSSRRHPQFQATEMRRWLADAGIAYRHEEALGGRRSPRQGSPHTALRNASFRAYADHMGSEAFRAALQRLLEEATATPTAVMCAESLWWRCHRRLLADAAVLLGGTTVSHLRHHGAMDPHRLTEGVRRHGESVVYDAGAPPLSGFPST